MKVNWNSKYTTISVYSMITAAAVIVFYLAVSQIGTFTDKMGEMIKILNPILIGFAMAYLLNFILKFYEDTILETSLFKKLKLKSKRGLGLLFTYITAFLLIGLFIQFVLPQLVESIVGLVNDIPTYISNAGKIINELLLEFEIGEEYTSIVNENINGFLNYIIQVAANLLPVLGGVLANVLSSVWNIVIGLVVSIYLLIDKEKFFGLSKKITFAFLSKAKADRLIELTHRSNDTFGRFLSGKILDSTIIGILTFVLLSILKMPYVLLISVIVGITNIIPFFGPFIGAIPSFIIILFVSPIQALWFLVLIFIIQQIDGNIIGPKILGDSIGISAFWILFSILVAGKFLGLLGMVIGVPLFAVIYSIIKEVVEGRLKNKGMKTETKDYM